MLLSCKKRAKRNQTKSEGRGKRQKSVKDASEGRRKTRKIHSSLESYPPMEPLACVIITLETSFWKSENERHSGPLQRKHLIFGYLAQAGSLWRRLFDEWFCVSASPARNQRRQTAAVLHSFRGGTVALPHAQEVLLASLLHTNMPCDDRLLLEIQTNNQMIR